jgi:hypothetical protein
LSLASQFALKIERYDKETGELWMRAFGIIDDIPTRTNWMAKNSKTWGRTTAKGKVVLDYEAHPGVHTAYKDLAKWYKDSAAVAVGIIEEDDVNQETGALDYIFKVTDEDFKQRVLSGRLNKGFTSPGIWGHKLRKDPVSGLKIYDDAELVHLALTRNPAFPKSIAKINENACIGGIQCAQELAAVAATPDTESEEKSEKFSFDKPAEHYKKTDNSKMTGEGDNPKTIPYEEYIGLKSAHDKELKTIQDKLDEAIKANDASNAKIKTVTSERDDYKSKVEEREKQDKETFFKERFGKIFKDNEQEVTDKVTHFLEKNLTEDDFTKLYGSMYDQALEAEKNEQEEAAKKVPSTDKAGIASSRNQSQMDNKLAENIELALSIANQRKRVI